MTLIYYYLEAITIKSVVHEEIESVVHKVATFCAAAIFSLSTLLSDPIVVYALPDPRAPSPGVVRTPSNVPSRPKRGQLRLNEFIDKKDVKLIPETLNWKEEGLALLKSVSIGITTATGHLLVVATPLWSQQPERRQTRIL